MAEWSYTRLETYRTCPHRYRLQYIDGAEVQVSPPFEFGRRFHEFAEAYARHCFGQGVPSDLDYARRLALKWRGVDDELENLCVAWAERTEFDWRITVADGESVERWIERPLPNGDTFRGRIDLVLYDRGEGLLVIRDYKTSWLYSPAQADDPPLQLLFYAWLAFNVWRDVDGAVLQQEYVRAGLTAQWQVEAPLQWVEQHIMQWIAEINADETFGARPGPHCAYCPYVLSCRPEWAELAPKSPDDIANLWLQIEREQEHQKQVRDVVRQWVAEQGPVELPDGRLLGLHEPEYARGQQQVPTVPRNRLLQFLQAVRQSGVDSDVVRRLIRLDAATLVGLVQAYPQLGQFVDWRAPRRTLAARRVRGDREGPDHAFADI